MEEARQSPPGPSVSRGAAGFTLVELLVVLAILGLLMGVVMPPIIHHFERAKSEIARIDIQNLDSALDLFHLDVGRYPTLHEGLAALLNRPEGIDSWQGPYLKQKALPTDPWGHPYQYRMPGEHGAYDLYSGGPDSADPADAKTKIANW